MILKGTNVIGHKIITLDKGEEVAKVKDIIYDPTQNKVIAILVEKGGLFSDSKIIMMEDISSVGEDAIVIPTKETIKKASDIKGKVSNIAKGDDYLTKSKIITEDGTELGNISDLMFDSTSGNVEQFEVSEGAIANIKSGKKYVKITDIITIGEDATIVRSYATEMFDMQGQNQGVQGIAQTLKQKTGEVTNTVKEKTQMAGDKIQEKSSELKDKAEEKGDQMKAKINDPENQKKTKDSLEDFMESAKEKFEEAKSNVKKTVDETGHKIKQNRIKDAIGKYLKINILSKDDKIIAKQGDMVTHEVIEKAERNGMLDQLLGNVTTDRLRMI